MFCSTIIPTVARPSLERAVRSVLDQELDGADFEVIVVNDSGRPLGGAAWQRSPHVRVIDTNRRERSLARNTGAAVSRGRYLHFLDDDDWLAPNALCALKELADREVAAWIYGATQLVDRKGRPLIQLRHRLKGNCFLQVMAGEWIPLQSSLIASQTFFDVGGFHPLLSGPEDIDLLRRVALTEELAGAEAIVAYVVRGDAGSTTDYREHSAQSRWARERILDQPEAFGRLRAAASSRDEWRARIARIYLTSAVWNLQRGRFSKAISRLTHGFAVLAASAPLLLSGRFWSSLASPYASETFARGIAASEKLSPPRSR
ncbi:MAG TPA: glycosyltransferase family 2 protein [Acidobacteriota bacterium]|nr:glycosyltransferase family 2 protein [Acidobacteriota bacterium]